MQILTLIIILGNITLLNQYLAGIHFINYLKTLQCYN